MSKQNHAVDSLYTVGADGQRNFLYPASVKGYFTTLRSWSVSILVIVLIVIPFIKVGKYPLIWLDIARRQFHLFGISLGPTDTYFLFFLLTGTAFSLFMASTLFGRVWCGYACPQTVFMEGVFRRIERLIEGTREQQIRLNQQEWNFEKIAKKAGKAIVFFLVSAFISHIVLSYFVSVDRYYELVRLGPKASPTVFIWTAVSTLILFFNFYWFREQLCIIICPYGRMQGVLSDKDSIIIGYDEKRGEPRRRISKSLPVLNAEAPAGACVDCNRCVAVCPTGIDIRQGFQLECIGCANCVDACNEVMRKVGRPEGLIRYDSQAGFLGEKKRFFRPRLWIYTVFGVVGLIAFFVTISTRKPWPVTLLRQSGAPFIIDGTTVRNAFRVEIHNKTQDAIHFKVHVDTPPSTTVTLPQQEFDIAAFGNTALPLFVQSPQSNKTFPVIVHVQSQDGKEVTLQAEFLGLH